MVTIHDVCSFIGAYLANDNQKMEEQRKQNINNWQMQETDS